MSLKIFALIAIFGLSACSQTDSLSDKFIQNDQQDPALSGNGRKIALIIFRNGQKTVELRELNTGKVLPLRHLTRHRPHSSPALSWSGRYVAVIAHSTNTPRIIIEDRLKGRLHPLFLGGNRLPRRISLSPDGLKLAIQLGDIDRGRIKIIDLSRKLDPDQAFQGRDFVLK